MRVSLPKNREHTPINTNNKKPEPGVSRENRISEEGLKRLENHLKSGRGMSQAVLDQWIKRYGEAAREIIEKYRGGKKK